MADEPEAADEPVGRARAEPRPSPSEPEPEAEASEASAEDEAAEPRRAYDEGRTSTRGESQVDAGPAAPLPPRLAPRPAARGRRDASTGEGPPAPPTVAEQAVHVNDRASAIFVIVVVAVFAIFLFA